MDTESFSDQSGCVRRLHEQTSVSLADPVHPMLVPALAKAQFGTCMRSPGNVSVPAASETVVSFGMANV
jgi:hypothetical protein